MNEVKKIEDNRKKISETEGKIMIDSMVII